MLIRTKLSSSSTILVQVTKTGASGREVELRADGTVVQWRYVGGLTWTNLVDIGVILPRGGGVGQVLAKLSDLDYDYAWKSSDANDKNYVVNFTNQATVTVDHNMGKYPSVTVFDSTGDEVVGDVEHISMNKLVVSFSSSFSGKVSCN